MSDENAISQSFSPVPGTTVSIAYTAASASVALTIPKSPGNQPGAVYNQIQVVNLGAGIVFVEFGSAAVVATLPAGAVPGSTAVGPNATKVFSIPFGGVVNAAAIAIAAGTGTVYFTLGTGI